jgi:hypothetical protein
LGGNYPALVWVWQQLTLTIDKKSCMKCYCSFAFFKRITVKILVKIHFLCFVKVRVWTYKLQYQHEGQWQIMHEQQHRLTRTYTSMDCWKSSICRYDRRNAHEERLLKPRFSDALLSLWRYRRTPSCISALGASPISHLDAWRSVQSCYLSSREDWRQ